MRLSQKSIRNEQKLLKIIVLIKLDFQLVF